MFLDLTVALDPMLPAQYPSGCLTLVKSSSNSKGRTYFQTEGVALAGRRPRGGS